MSFTVDDRVLALAGIAQALQQVRRIADTGHSDAAAVRTAVDSVFRVDASSPQAVFGDRHALKSGLRLLHNYFRSQGQDPMLPKLALSVLQLERRFVQDGATVNKVASGIERAQRQATELGDSGHPDVLANLGGLYADTISHLKPRVCRATRTTWARPAWWRRSVPCCWPRCVRRCCGASWAAATGTSCSAARR